MTRCATVLLVLGVMAIVTGCGEPAAPPEPTATPRARDENSQAQAVSNTLNWEATAERGVYGYVIYRADDRSGPFRRINAQVVRVPQGPEENHSYTYVDEAVEPGRTYHYYLDALAETGVKQRFSGIVTKTTSG
jgi:hypothetical protein